MREKKEKKEKRKVKKKKKENQRTEETNIRGRKKCKIKTQHRDVRLSNRLHSIKKAGSGRSRRIRMKEVSLSLVDL